MRKAALWRPFEVLDHYKERFMLELVAGTGVDHNLRSTPVKMVAGGRNHLYLQASCNEASKVTAEEAVGEVQSFLTNLFQTAA